MNRLLDYKDDIVLLQTAQDGYGDNQISQTIHLKGLFVQGTGQSEANYVEGISADAHVYLDIENPFVQENAFRLEGMYVICNIFNGRENESWYKIARCKVGQRKLLDNDINNVECFLTKCDALDIWEES